MIQIKATFGLLTILGSMDTYDAATARQKIELYREYLAKGVHGGMAVVYLVEIAKLELLLSQVEANSKQPDDRLRR